MKKRFSFFVAGSLLILVFISGCLKDTVKRSYTYTLYRPVYETKSSVRQKIKSSAPVAIAQPGKLVVKGPYIFLNEIDKGIHVIDNSNPAQPKNTAFIAIPGCADLAVNGNTLYADLYTDLVALDITNPLDVHPGNIITSVFPERYYTSYYGLDSAQVVIDWIKKDTTVTESYDVSAWQNKGRGGIVVLPNCPNCDFFYALSSAPVAAVSTVGTGGSMARFTILNNRLYTVGASGLSTFNISTPLMPELSSVQQIGFNVETIFPLKDKLLIGATNGMFIFDTEDPDRPTQLSQYTHVQSCDPVIADGDFAYVTLRSGTACNGFTNQMEVLTITNLLQPALLKTYPLTHPMGLSKDDNLLFVCDDMDGLKIYNAEKPNDLQLLKTFNGLETYDVIAANGLAIVVAKDGLYQFDYSDKANIKQLSKLSRD